MKNSLRTYRKRSELTILDVAQLMGIKESSTLSRCERNRRNPCYKVVFVYHLLFDVPIEKIFDDDVKIIFNELIKNIDPLIEELKKQGETKRNNERIAFLKAFKKKDINMEKTISIYANLVGFGFVIISSRGEIIDYGIVSYRSVRNEKCFRHVKKIILYYHPETIILEDYKYTHKSERVKNLIDLISNYNNNNQKIYKYSREQIRQTFEIFGARNKFEISRRISEIYPQLKSKLPEKRRTWEPENYYQGIFDAMSLYLTHQYLND